MDRTLRELSDSDVGTRIRVPYTQVEGVLESFSAEYGDDVKIVVDGNPYYLPAEYPVVEAMDFGDYDPSVLLGVVDPWSPL